MKYYSTGQFAKLANVTLRTVRYYDKIGLLKPSLILHNGYRKYSDKDLMVLQKIILLKHLGFSINEIFPLVVYNESNELIESLKLQKDLVNKQIHNLKNLDGALRLAIKSSEEKKIKWDDLAELLHLTNAQNAMIEQFKNSSNLNIRLSLHERFSVNPVNWYSWISDKVDLSHSSKVLEVGCGNGVLWKNVNVDIRHREIFLSDVSEGMLDEARTKLGDDYSYLLIDCERIPFKNAYFDTILANHVLFYVKDLKQTLLEINRCLSSGGYFYCTTYGKDHMREISELVKAHNPKITLEEDKLYEIFGMENGREILSQYFAEVECIPYYDHLEITEMQPLIEYIMSCHGIQNEILGKSIDEFKKSIHRKIVDDGFLKITKQACLFRCKKK